VQKHDSVGTLVLPKNQSCCPQGDTTTAFVAALAAFYQQVVDGGLAHNTIHGQTCPMFRLYL
jgi:hypothetical protein